MDRVSLRRKAPINVDSQSTMYRYEAILYKVVNAEPNRTEPGQLYCTLNIIRGGLHPY